MARPVTLFTGQWADLTLDDLAAKAQSWGYDGLELACWGDHFDVQQALKDDGYCQGRHDLLGQYDMKTWAISSHLVGQGICDIIDSRHQEILPTHVWGDGDPAGVTRRAMEEMKDTARAAAKLGVGVVNGFTGSAIWHLLYSFPPVSPDMIQAGFDQFAERWNEVLDVFKDEGVKFALEVHPTEIAFDLVSAQRALDALDNRPEFGFNFDPSHLHWQFVDPVKFIDAFADRIYHVHMKDAITTLDGTSGILSSYLNFGEAARGWDFRSLGRGGVDFEEIVRALNRAGYAGPLSVEWEDSGMDREAGASEACEFVRQVDFEPSAVAFDAAFDSDSQ